MPDDWFDSFARRPSVQQRRSRATRATRATAKEIPTDPRGTGKPTTVAQGGRSRATRATANVPVCPAVMASQVSVAPVARQTRIEATQPKVVKTAKESGLLTNVAPVARVAPETDVGEPGHERDAWDAVDWRTHYDERAAIAEYDHGLTRPAAEAHAFDCCVSEYLRRHAASNAAEGSCVIRTAFMRREAAACLSR